MTDGIELAYLVRSEDPEIQAIEVVLLALRGFDREARARVLRYVTERETNGDGDE